jgi:recombination protein RecT
MSNDKPTTTALERRQTPTLKAYLEAAGPKLREICARHLPADRLMRLAVAAVSRTPQLQKCRPETLLSAIFIAGRLGLEPDGVLGSAYLVPFGDECQLIIGYRGLIDLATRSGKVISIVSRVVHEKDLFRVRLGTDEAIKHIPSDDEDPGPMTHVYAVARLADGSPKFEVMSRKQVDAIRARSRGKGGPWSTDYEEMARKTVIRRLAKSLPMSTEFAASLTLQAGAESGEANVVEVGEALALAPALADVRATAEGEIVATATTVPEGVDVPPIKPAAEKETVEQKRARALARAAGEEPKA